MSRLKRLIHEVHRRSLWQVLAIFVASGWIVLQVIDLFIERGIAPEWVFTAGLFLLLGFPIGLATPRPCTTRGATRRARRSTTRCSWTCGPTPIRWSGHASGRRRSASSTSWRSGGESMADLAVPTGPVAQGSGPRRAGRSVERDARARETVLEKAA